MSDQRGQAGKGVPGSSPHGRFIGSAARADVGQIVELQAEVQRLWRQLCGKRCPRNPGMLIAYCAQCQKKEPGHGSEVIIQQLADTRLKLRELNGSLTKG